MRFSPKRPGPSEQAQSPAAPESDVPDCPVDISNTTVAVLAEAKGVTLVFRLQDPSDAAAMDALRLRVHALADRYRRERIVLKTPGGHLERSAFRDGSGQPSLAAPGGPSRAGSAANEQARRVDAESGQTIDSSGGYTVTVENTSDGARILLTSKDPAELDLLRARLTQDTQVMTQSGSCPW